MSHFTVFWPSRPSRPLPGARSTVVDAYRDGFREESVAVDEPHDGWLARVDSAPTTARFERVADGWVVWTGSPLDLDAGDAGVPDGGRWLDALAAGDAARINRFEGTFAAAAWHAPTRRGFALNDQTSNLNLYVVETEEGLWVTTAALPLARALGLDLDGAGLGEFFARGTVLAPTTMFAGMRRLDLGERVTYADGHAQSAVHWTPCATSASPRDVRSAAVALSELAIDRTRRLAAGVERVVSDLTGGFDSRIVATAAAAAGRLDAVTVDGPETHSDVRIARRIAAAVGWDCLHFDPAVEWTEPVDAATRRELTYRVNGELPFADVYPHRLARPRLAARFGLHLNGGGGELMRSFPWSQEFLGIGRRRRANVQNALSYRFFQEGPPPAGLFDADWHALAVERVRARLTAMFDAMQGTRTTRQLDAAYLWRMSGFAPYTSAVAGWMRSVSPLMCATTVDLATGLPWPSRLTTRLVRRMIALQHAEAAAVEARYGGALRAACRLAWKFDRVRLGGTFSRVLPRPAAEPVAKKPYRTDELRAFLDPRVMYSAGLYREGGLEHTLRAGEGWTADERWLPRVATVEQLCRELGRRPGAEKLLQVSGSISTRTR